MKKLLEKWRTKILDFLTPQPEIQEEYVDKVVRLLRRDFTTTEQNEIILSIIKKISDKRLEDIINAEREFSVLQKDTNFLKDKVVLT